jgi:hypothetical protein
VFTHTGVGKRAIQILRSALDESELECEGIGGEHCDEVSGVMDLAETIIVRTDQGAVFSVHGWLIDVAVLERTERAM